MCQNVMFKCHVSKCHVDQKNAMCRQVVDGVDVVLLTLAPFSTLISYPYSLITLAWIEIWLTALFL